MELKKLGLRVLVAIFGAPLIIFLILKGGLPFAILVLVINLVSQHEFFRLTESKGMQPLKSVGMLGGFTITISFYYAGLQMLWVVALSTFYCVLLIELFRNKGSATLNIAATAWGLFYPPVFFGFMILLRELPLELNMDYQLGGRWILLMLITIWVCDTAAYFVGKAVGKHKLYSRISPHKTVEGAIAGVLFSFITAYIFHLSYIKSLTLFQCMVIAMIVAIMSQLGDLVESVFKRDAGVKDSSSLLPGHGGMLDRFDAPLFVAPLVYFYLKFIVFV
ncbi:MAG: phosphatidate cytidylyltransferase [bacterium]|nr:phosphatidate cytidylyltransferase [bacterium]